MKECYDYLGNKFKSMTKMCEFHNVPLNAYSRRIYAGWSNAEALMGKRDCRWTDEEINLLKKNYPLMGSSVTNLLGGRTERAVRNKARELKLKAPGNTKGSPKKITDPWGKDFPSKKELCKYYNISQGAFRGLLYRGKSVEQALAFLLNKKKVYDHLGNEFSSEKEMCKFHNIKPGTYWYRKQMGWSSERALTEPLLQSTPVGTPIVSLNGVKGVIEERSPYKIIIRFEDNKAFAFKNISKIRYPALSMSKKSNFHCFNTIKGREGDDGNVWYKCTCTICNQSFVQTPQFMIEHHEQHMKNGETNE